MVGRPSRHKRNLSTTRHITNTVLRREGFQPARIASQSDVGGPFPPYNTCITKFLDEGECYRNIFDKSCIFFVYFVYFVVSKLYGSRFLKLGEDIDCKITIHLTV